MNLEKCNDTEQSVEMQSALKRFEDVCTSLENEHTKLLELEKKRQKLNADLERLRNEITEEKKHFRSVIDGQIVCEEEDNSNHCYENEHLRELYAIKEYIANRRDELISHEDGEENCNRSTDKGSDASFTIDLKKSDVDDVSIEPHSLD